MLFFLAFFFVCEPLVEAVSLSVGGSVGLTSGVVDGVASSSDSCDSSRAAKFLFALRPMGAGAVVVQQVLVRRVFIPLTVGLDLNSVNGGQNVSRLFAAYCCRSLGSVLIAV